MLDHPFFPPKAIYTYKKKGPAAVIMSEKDFNFLDGKDVSKKKDKGKKGEKDNKKYKEDKPD